MKEDNVSFSPFSDDFLGELLKNILGEDADGCKNCHKNDDGEKCCNGVKSDESNKSEDAEDTESVEELVDILHNILSVAYKERAFQTKLYYDSLIEAGFDDDKAVSLTYLHFKQEA